MRTLSVPWRGLKAGLLVCGLTLGSFAARGQTMPPMTMPAMLEDEAIAHAILEQFEGRASGSSVDFRYDAQAWYGTDEDKVWIKSEGRTGPGGKLTDGEHELLYDRAVSAYFDLQGGVRLDLDSGSSRAWAAFGIQGLAIDFFEIEATAYASDRGAAGRFKASYDLPLTQRLILQPEAELNFYSAADKARGTAAGLSDIDAGLRLRYELTRKFAPYLGVSYQGRFGETGGPDSKSDVRIVFGVRAWL
jgi:copper resistance protein B